MATDSLLNFNFSYSAIMAGFIFSIFGIYLLKNGRKQGNFWHVVIGLGLMIYPYFIASTYLLWGIGTAGLWFAYVKR